ncbi:TPA: tetratricopeptide repeat protein [Pseudomonas putida]|uniref:Tetratricopeptide repeat protein n=1 Tax=Pseudomonas putida TaxID=303 RepID=A0ABD7B6R1_PSEPU|nr:MULTISPECIES: tetratricopeptide repeat protein [Pseudomonas]MBA1318912.1 tetratricopeptide repeat protein [Pseudomonas monteilii]MCE1020755.1 tetratricopeptide repeat protein [Pseudomonas monteilii]MCE1038239.1 tetratricopeptide repeat protein [Pseudomonas monteilii]MCE1089849.1 tetratricopeptide repeat protein [Pseudomonas monteilii]MDH0023491.1 tetratricopeptide repeat protein [Pseudomonas monteilii]
MKQARRHAANVTRGMALLWLCAWAGGLLAAPSQPPQRKLDDGYVDPGQCQACHASQAQQWSQSHHSWSMRKPTADNVRGDFADQAFTDAAGVEVSFSTRNGTFYVNAENEQGRRQDFAVAYTFGVYPLQQYLIERPGGRLQSLTVAWDNRAKADGGQRWFSLYPGQRFTPDDALHWTGRSQNWNGMCAQCHSGNLKKGYDARQDSFASTWSELSVGCQSCHGPGAQHLAWAKLPTAQRQLANNAGARGLQVDFGARAKGYEVDQCARCHAQQETLGVGSQPGKPLVDSAYPTLLTPGAYHADGQQQAEVFEYGSFVQSKMYAAGVTCSDCHNPHTGELPAQGNQLCASCHNPQGNPRFPTLKKKDYDSPSHHFHEPGSPGAQCTNCHAPEQNYMVIDARRDHSFRLPRPDLTPITGAPNACTQCHKERSAQWAANEISQRFGPLRAEHYGPVMQGARAHDPQAIALAAKLVTDATRPAIVRASAADVLSGVEGPALDSLALGLTDQDPLVRSSVVRAMANADDAQRLQHLPALLDDPALAVRDQAARALADLQAQLPTAQRDRLGHLLQDHLARLSANADLPGTRFNLASLLARQGNEAQALDQYHQVLRQDPDFTPARVALARLLLTRGQSDQALETLQAGLQRGEQRAGFSELAYAMGLLQAERQQPEQAIEWLEKALPGQPLNLRLYYNLGLLRSQLGQPEQARRVVVAGLAHAAQDRDLLYAGAYLDARSGNWASSFAFLQRLLMLQPQHPEARRLLAYVQQQQQRTRTMGANR